MMRSFIRSHHFWLWLLFAVALLIRGWGLAAQPPLDDEVSAAFSAENYVRHGLLGQVMWYHPPLRNLVLYLTGNLFGGYSAWGLRFGPVLLGSLSIPLTGYCAQALFGRMLVTLTAAFFLAVDPLHIGLSREAFQEAITPCFILGGVLSAVLGLKGRGLWWHYLAGLLFGLASSSKWHGLFPWVVCAAVLLVYPLRSGQNKEPFPVRLLTVSAAYVLLPVTVYIAVWFPWLFHGGHSLSEFIELQGFLVNRQYHHEGPALTVRYVPHRAWQWFVWPVPWNDFVNFQGKAYLNVAMGNCLAWFLTLPSLFLVARQWLKQKDYATGLAISLFLASYLPLVLTSRGVWVFSAPAVIPFAFMLSGYALSLLMDRGTITRTALCWYFTAVTILSAFQYPMVTMRTLEFGYAKAIAEFYNPHPERSDHEVQR